MQKRQIKPVLLILGFVLAALLGWYYSRNPLSTRVQIGDDVLTVDLAVTASEKELGLGGRQSMAPDHGMMFVYDHKEQYGFWMKGMQFPLDFIWIADKTVVDITQNVPITTQGKITTVSPRVPVDKILEVNAGTVQRLGIEIGDHVVFKVK